VALAHVAAEVSDRIAAVAAEVGPSVVRVGGRSRPGPLGSGVRWGASGAEVVTNAHVVQGQAQVSVSFHDGVTRAGSVVAFDRLYDLALVRGDWPAGPPVVPSDREARPGELVVAVGNPFGFGWTVTLGVVSAVDRMVGPLDGLVQTDAAINPGNSGGALVDMDGRLLGIPTLAVARGQNLGFAIPAWQVARVAEELRQLGRARHPWIGISGATEVVEPSLARLLELPADRGVAVVAVEPGSPAAAAGLLALDLIASADGRPIPSIAALLRAIRAGGVGRVITFGVVRQGRLVPVAVWVGELPAALAAGL
jgi:S1-C subfamily serine protease